MLRGFDSPPQAKQFACLSPPLHTNNKIRLIGVFYRVCMWWTHGESILTGSVQVVDILVQVFPEYLATFSIPT